MQNSGPWDPWLPVVENRRLFAQRTVRPQMVGKLSWTSLPQTFPAIVYTMCSCQCGGWEFGSNLCVHCNSLRAHTADHMISPSGVETL